MKKALLLRLSALGDVVIATSAIEMLHRQGFSVFILTRKPYDELFRCDERISGTLTISRKPDLKEIRMTVRAIREQNFDLVIDIHRKPLTALLLKASGGKLKLTYDKRIIKRRMAVWFHKKIDYVPVAELYQRPIRRALGLPPKEFHRPQLRPCRRTPGFDLPDDYIVLAPEAVHEPRIWPHYGALCRLFRSELKLPVVIVGTDRERADGVVGKCFSGNGSPEAINLAGQTDIQALMAVIAGAKAVVSNDSGPMHIADALDVPIVALFGPTIPEFGFRPLSPKSEVLELDLPCRPCSLHGEKPCKRGDLACLRLIPPEDVVDAVRRLISE